MLNRTPATNFNLLEHEITKSRPIKSKVTIYGDNSKLNKFVYVYYFDEQKAEEIVAKKKNLIEVINSPVRMALGGVQYEYNDICKLLEQLQHGLRPLLLYQ